MCAYVSFNYIATLQYFYGAQQKKIIFLLLSNAKMPYGLYTHSIIGRFGMFCICTYIYTIILYVLVVLTYTRAHISTRISYIYPHIVCTTTFERAFEYCFYLSWNDLKYLFFETYRGALLILCIQTYLEMEAES